MCCILHEYICKHTIQIHVQLQNTCGYCCSGMNAFINFLTSVLRHEERDTILTMLTPSWRDAHLVVIKISVGRDPKIPTEFFNGRNSPPYLNGKNSTVCLHRPISTHKLLFFKILTFSGPSLPGMMSSTLQPHFLSGGLLWQWWLSYPLRTSVKLHPMTMPWAKLNDKI